MGFWQCEFMKNIIQASLAVLFLISSQALTASDTDVFLIKAESVTIEDKKMNEVDGSVHIYGK